MTPTRDTVTHVTTVTMQICSGWSWIKIDSPSMCLSTVDCRMLTYETQSVSLQRCRLHQATPGVQRGLYRVEVVRISQSMLQRFVQTLGIDDYSLYQS